MNFLFSAMMNKAGVIRLASVFAAIFLIASATVPGRAQEITASHLEAARQAIRATHASDQFDDILPNIAEEAKADLISNRPDEEEQISQIVNQAALELAPRRGDLENEIARVYAKTFSEDELKNISTFFTSDAGKKLLDLGPVLDRQLDQASRVWASGIGRDLGQLINKQMTALNAKEGKAAPAAEAPAAAEGEAPAEEPAKKKAN